VLDRSARVTPLITMYFHKITHSIQSIETAGDLNLNNLWVGVVKTSGLLPRHRCLSSIMGKLFFMAADNSGVTTEYFPFMG